MDATVVTNDEDINLPGEVVSVLSRVGLDVTKEGLTKLVKCPNCKCAPKSCSIARQFSPGTCVQFICQNKAVNKKKCYSWYVCVECKSSLSGKRVGDHFTRGKRHLQRFDIAFDTKKTPAGRAAAVIADDGDAVTYLEDALDVPFEELLAGVQGFEADLRSLGQVTESSGSGGTGAISTAGQSVDGNTTIATTETITRATVKAAPNTYAGTNALPEPDMRTWLQKAFETVQKATVHDLVSVLGKENEVLLFHSGELAGLHGGIVYMASRAFLKTWALPNDRCDIASTKEAIFHFLAFSQYITMGDSQRRREALIQSALQEHISHNSLFQSTNVLPYKELNRHYGRSNQHTMWNTLPVPRVENINGIAYVSPYSALLYMMACAKDMDDFMVEVPASNATSNNNPPATFTTFTVVNHITESKAASEWKKQAYHQLQAEYPGGLKCVLLWYCDWRDGFGANRTKQNRKSTNAWTISFSTPKGQVNSLSNTLPIALGLKKNPHWHLVEKRFKEDASQFGKGLRALTVYRGGDEKKCITVLVRRLACLTDKVERADYTASLSCTSKYHRLFGVNVRFDPPVLHRDQIKLKLHEQATGIHDSSLRNYGWSCQYVERAKNGGLFPACFECRKKTVDWLRRPDFGAVPTGESCLVCANWVLNETTRERMMFAAPKDYPPTSRSITVPECPVKPPPGREPGLGMLPFIKMTFPLMVQAAKFAFFHTYHAKQGTGWTKGMCQSYLRSCGLSTAQQEAIYYAARAAAKQGLDVDFGLPDRVASCEFPAAWTGDLEFQQFIEMLMHLIFLGLTESNFKLGNMFLQATGRPVKTFMRTVQALLKELNKYNLSWLLVLPFSGSEKTKYTTGTWVAENWLALVRIAKIIYAYSMKRGLVDERVGSNDLVRMVAAFTAFVSRVLTHGGISENSTVMIDLLLKEFLSSVRELDIRTRYDAMHKLGGTVAEDDSTSDAKNRDQWWLKSNYVSTLNLVPTMRLLGPLVNWWDGGGKAERYIQEIKPHIPRGVRDGGMFFPRLLEKVYKLDCIKQIEATLSPTSSTRTQQESTGKDVGVDSDSEVEDVLEDDDAGEDQLEDGEPENPPVNTIEFQDRRTGDPEDDELSYDGDRDDEAEQQELPDEEEEQWSTPMEDQQMAKARTYYIYRNESNLQEAVENHAPIVGIIVKSARGFPVMYAIYRKPRKQYGWKKVMFVDTSGIHFCGMWYAPVIVQEVASPPESAEDITNMAKMASVAIPLRYMVGNDHQDRLKYCVITNWWKERDHSGQYVLPTLAFDYYKEEVQPADSA